MAALADHQRELGALGLPVGAEARRQHPLAEEGAAVCRPRLVDAAALAANAVGHQTPGCLSKSATAITLQQSVQVPQARPGTTRDCARAIGFRHG